MHRQWASKKGPRIPGIASEDTWHLSAASPPRIDPAGSFLVSRPSRASSRVSNRCLSLATRVDEVRVSENRSGHDGTNQNGISIRGRRRKTRR